MTAPLLTPRLRLVAVEARHFAGLRELWTNPEVMRNVGFPAGLDPDDVRLDDHVASDSGGSVTTPRGRRPGVHMAVETRDGSFVGEAKLGAPDAAGVCEPDVKLLPAWWGKGYGEEIARALVAETFARWPECAKVRFTPNVENHRARALYVKLGARRVGEGYAAPGSVPLRGFVGVHYVVLEIERRGPASGA